MYDSIFTSGAPADARPAHGMVASPENKEILSTWRIVLVVGMLGTAVGLPSDLENIPAAYAATATAVRLAHFLCFSLLMLVAWRYPAYVLRYHAVIAVAVIGSVYVYLTWLDAVSGDITKSGYHRSLVLPSIALMVFRRMKLWWQTFALTFAVVYYGFVIAYNYDLSLFGSGADDKHYRDVILDLAQIHLILFLVFRRYRTYQTEELRLRHLLGRANDAKSEIIAKVNHELQVPVLGILANLDSMEKLQQGKEAERMRRIIDRTHNYCLYQRTLINNMIYASVQDVQDPFYIDRDDLASLTECYRKSVQLVRDIHDGAIDAEAVPDVFVACQSEILMIILINILSNCAEHSSQVQIHWERSANMLTMYTKNSLVTPLDLEAIFDKWTTSRQNRTKPILGLGLNIARDLIEKVGGDIEAREEENVFHLAIRLPISA